MRLKIRFIKKKCDVFNTPSVKTIVFCDVFGCPGVENPIKCNVFSIQLTRMTTLVNQSGQYLANEKIMAVITFSGMYTNFTNFYLSIQFFKYTLYIHQFHEFFFRWLDG